MTKTNLLLLHGALGSRQQLEPLANLLAERYDEHYAVHLLDFEGHGTEPLRDRPFRIEHFAENVRDYLEAHSITAARIFGYSMGGFVACQLALTHPHLVRRIATLGTIFRWDADVAARERTFLDLDKIKTKVPQFAQALESRHTASDWETVVTHTSEMLELLATTGGFQPDLACGLSQSVRIIVGDRDTSAGVVPSYEIYKALPNGQLEVLPNTPHPIERVPIDELAASLENFFE
jgi:pimeloyl-ACP methyl ester carboxylesterase